MITDTPSHPPAAAAAAAACATNPAAGSARIGAIDGLRGLVMLLMLVDHSRETFFFGHPVADPMDVASTTPGLFFTRLAAHLCAPIFVALTGLAAWLYGARRPAAATSAFLLKRGLFLVVLEVTVVGFAWSFAWPPTTVFLQVIWAIGWSMIALAALVHLPRVWIAAIGGVIVAGHNLLDPIAIAAGDPGHVLWAILHDRGYIDLWEGARARTSYPVFPWIGVIALGYAIGPWFAADASADTRTRNLRRYGIAALVAFAVIRGVNGYGDPSPWQAGATPLATLMSVLNVTKYPPSLDFLLLTLGIGMLLLAVWPESRGPESRGPESNRLERAGRWLAVLGSAPLFFYVLHLYVLHLLRIAAAAASGVSTTDLPDLPSVGWLWLIAAGLAPPLWLATRWFAARKRASGAAWMRYL